MDAIVEVADGRGASPRRRVAVRAGSRPARAFRRRRAGLGTEPGATKAPTRTRKNLLGARPKLKLASSMP